jgi:hypothetical protein
MGFLPIPLFHVRAALTSSRLTQLWTEADLDGDDFLDRSMPIEIRLSPAAAIPVGGCASFRHHFLVTLRIASF